MTAASPKRPWRPAQSAPLSARGHDLYETPDVATRALLHTGELDHFWRSVIWEPAAGRGAISRELIAAGFNIVATDLIAYDGADPGIATPIDFFTVQKPPAGAGIIVTNPPYKDADAFVRHGLELGLPMIVLMRLQALEGSGRSDLIDRRLRRVWLGIERLPTMHREGWRGPRTKSGGAPFGWFVFLPGARSSSIEIKRISWRAAEPSPNGEDQ